MTSITQRNAKLPLALTHHLSGGCGILSPSQPRVIIFHSRQQVSSLSFYLWRYRERCSFLRKEKSPWQTFRVGSWDHMLGKREPPKSKNNLLSTVQYLGTVLLDLLGGTAVEERATSRHIIIRATKTNFCKAAISSLCFEF